MSEINQKEYLKKYLGIGKTPSEKKKKKKKKDKIGQKRVKIIDDDADANIEIIPDDDPLNEDAPQIVAIIDERPPSLRIDEKTNSHLWKPIGTVSSSTDQPTQKLLGTSFKIGTKHNDKAENQEDAITNSPINQTNKERDISPPRKRKYDKDSSPPRKRSDDISPPRKRTEDNSPPRRTKDQDTSPPRKRKTDDNSPPRRPNDHDNSPPRRRRSNGDSSPPRKRKVDDNASKHRRKDGDSPRRKRINSPQPRRKDNSPPRRIKQEQDDDSAKMKTTLDGRKAGLQNADQLIDENRRFRERENELFQTISKEQSGINAAPVLRDRKTGKIRNIEEEQEYQRKKQQDDEKRKEKYSRWGRGLKQVENYEQKLQNDLHEMSKPLARYADDEDLERHLKEQEREGDPMLQYIRKKKRKEAKEKGVVEKPQFEGEFMPNRYGIRPGHRWDGVDRSNGYEKRWFDTQNAKRAEVEESYKWSTEDM